MRDVIRRLQAIDFCDAQCSMLCEKCPLYAVKEAIDILISVRTEERERCAKLCEQLDSKPFGYEWGASGIECAREIRKLTDIN
jgi:hypothetical protein